MSPGMSLFIVYRISPECDPGPGLELTLDRREWVRCGAATGKFWNHVQWPSGRPSIVRCRSECRCTYVTLRRTADSGLCDVTCARFRRSARVGRSPVRGRNGRPCGWHQMGSNGFDMTFERRNWKWHHLHVNGLRWNGDTCSRVDCDTVFLVADGRHCVRLGAEFR